MMGHRGAPRMLRPAREVPGAWEGRDDLLDRAIDAVHHRRLDVDRVIDVFERIAIDKDDVGELAGFERTEVVLDAQSSGGLRVAVKSAS